MKIVLDRDDVMRLICKEYNIETIETQGGGVIPGCDLVYWEGHPDDKIVEREVAKEKEE